MRDWPNLPPIPTPGARLVELNGLMNVEWYRYFAALDPVIRALPTLALNDLADVDAETPADTEVLTFVDADGTWQPA